MASSIRLSPGVQALLCCPVCRAKLEHTGELFECTNAECATRFPVLDGVPVLINEQSSVFSLDDYVARRPTYFVDRPVNKLRRAVRRSIPSIDRNIKARSNYSRLRQVLLGQLPSPRVLVIGGSVQGQGMESLANEPAIECVLSDVSCGARTMLVCDAHDLPFQDGSFDGVVVQAVLEHVVDPYRCCQEIHRVLRGRGVVYAETPFMQQVHGGRYDFTRFTHLGHRRLFRGFEEIDSGAVCGPGMALAWAYQYFLLSFPTSKTWRTIVRAFASATSFHLKYFDHYLIDKPGALDAASGYYFMGRKTDRVLSDRELIELYRGAG